MLFILHVLSLKSFSTFIRITIILQYKKHHSFWYADKKKYYSRLVAEDIFIRNYINQHFNVTPISKIEICRNIVDYIISININICVARAGVIASRNRKNLLDLRNKLSYFLKLHFDRCIVNINLVDITNPDSDARFLAQFARQQLEQRVPFRRVIRTTILKAQKVKVKGIKVQIAGRLNGTEIARTEWVREGQVPLHTLKANIDYCSYNALKI